MIKWSFNGGSLPSNVAMLNIGNIINYHILTIEEADRENEGTYTCHGRTESMYRGRLLFFEAEGQIYVESKWK